MLVQLIIGWKDKTWTTETFRDPEVNFGDDCNLHSSHYAKINGGRGVQSVFQVGNDIAFAPLVHKLRGKPRFRNAVFFAVANIHLPRGGWIGWSDIPPDPPKTRC